MDITSYHERRVNIFRNEIALVRVDKRRFEEAMDNTAKNM